MNRQLSYFLFILAVVISDQLSKFIITRKVSLMTIKSVVPGFFNITYIRNRGAIFGFLSGSGSQFIYIVLTLASLTALSLVVYYFFRTPHSERFMKISLSLILAGALGNLIDRIFRGYVVDFLDFYIKKWHWPSFNIADLCISIGAILLIYTFLVKKRTKCTQNS